MKAVFFNFWVVLGSFFVSDVAFAQQSELFKRAFQGIELGQSIDSIQHARQIEIQPDNAKLKSIAYDKSVNYYLPAGARHDSVFHLKVAGFFIKVNEEGKINAMQIVCYYKAGILRNMVASLGCFYIAGGASASDDVEDDCLRCLETLSFYEWYLTGKSFLSLNLTTNWFLMPGGEKKEALAVLTWYPS
ncbi:hypothetical protein EGT74_04960 [Chitinophaga lutea]|uniref:Uncharacterized protein n=1 Tax=Chitinophaga lutea TaxID=2488634 RepID=A0A3N4QA42_9BACT|nr:hypothetical protein [Chitinophaga lutea]RPE12897.1 hypothetical protein EGT74_04960 [Chitinophaga lutea]